MSKSKNIIGQRGQIALVLTLISAGLLVAGVLTGSLIAQKATPAFTTTAAGGDWNQCNVPHDNLPCGSCLVKSVGKGTMTFGCELKCAGNNIANCPGGNENTYQIEHVWDWCKKAGTGPCGNWATGDYKASGVLTGGPWTIKSNETIERQGNFPAPDCGRVQVDVKMTGTGTSVAGSSPSYDTGKDCDGTTQPPVATNTPTPPCAADGSCYLPNKPCCSGKTYNDESCPVTDTRCGTSSLPPPIPPVPPGSCESLAIGGVCIKNTETCPKTKPDYFGEAGCYLNEIIAVDQRCCIKKTEPLPGCLQKNGCYSDNAQICCEGSGLKKITYLKDPNFSYPSCTSNSDTKGFCLQCSSDLECIKGDEVCCPGYAPMALDNLGTYLHLPSFLNCRSKGYEHVCLKSGIPSEVALESSSKGVSGIKLGSFDPTEYNKVILQSWTTGNLNATDISRQINEYSTNYSIQMRSCYPNLPVSDPNSCR